MGKVLCDRDGNPLIHENFGWVNPSADDTEWIPEWADPPHEKRRIMPPWYWNQRCKDRERLRVLEAEIKVKQAELDVERAKLALRHSWRW